MIPSDDPDTRPGAPESSGPDRYSRQILFPKIGRDGQAKLARARVVLVGAGALGATSAELLVRSGVGTLRIIDRDVVETSNLGRQALYTTDDALVGRPKATALTRHLAAFNPEVRCDPRVADLSARNARELLDGFDLVVDALDNLEARYLINDWAIQAGVPWVYGACVGSRGLSAVVMPGTTPCLRCLFPDPPPAGELQTCDTAGIIAPAATLVASLQVAEALKILVGASRDVRRTLLSVELWPFRWIELGGRDASPVPNCVACGQRKFEFLDSPQRGAVQVLCGRDSVQIVPSERSGVVNLEAVRARVRTLYSTKLMEEVLRIEAHGLRITLFQDGRALVGGTSDAAVARSAYDRIVGS